MLHSAGLEDWIAENDDEYVAKAIAFANDRDALAELRQGLRARLIASPLCDARRFARHLEAAFEGMWQERIGELSRTSAGGLSVPPSEWV
jgi:predicted O-linked N-acetylglucosamine transferase (SPINDLY family)